MKVKNEVLVYQIIKNTKLMDNSTARFQIQVMNASSHSFEIELVKSQDDVIKQTIEKGNTGAIINLDVPMAINTGFSIFSLSFQTTIKGFKYIGNAVISLAAIWPSMYNPLYGNLIELNDPQGMRISKIESIIPCLKTYGIESNFGEIMLVPSNSRYLPEYF